MINEMLGWSQMKNYKGHMNFNIWWLVKLEILLVLDGYVMLGFALDWDQLWGFDEDILICWLCAEGLG